MNVPYPSKLSVAGLQLFLSMGIDLVELFTLFLCKAQIALSQMAKSPYHALCSVWGFDHLRAFNRRWVNFTGRTLLQVFFLIFMCLLILILEPQPSHTRAHTHTHTHAYTHTPPPPTHTHTYRDTPTCTHAHTHAVTYIHNHERLPSCMRTRLLHQECCLMGILVYLAS